MKCRGCDGAGSIATMTRDGRQLLTCRLCGGSGYPFDKNDAVRATAAGDNEKAAARGNPGGDGSERMPTTTDSPAQPSSSAGYVPICDSGRLQLLRDWASQNSEHPFILSIAPTVLAVLADLRAAEVALRDKTDTLEILNREFIAQRTELERVKGELLEARLGTETDQRNWRLAMDQRDALQSRLTAAESEAEQLRKALEDAVQNIAGGRLCSIGSINNTYEAQIGVEQVKGWRAALGAKEGM